MFFGLKYYKKHFLTKIFGSVSYRGPHQNHLFFLSVSYNLPLYTYLLINGGNWYRSGRIKCSFEEINLRLPHHNSVFVNWRTDFGTDVPGNI